MNMFVHAKKILGNISKYNLRYARNISIKYRSNLTLYTNKPLFNIWLNVKSKVFVVRCRDTASEGKMITRAHFPSKFTKIWYLVILWSQRYLIPYMLIF